MTSPHVAALQAIVRGHKQLDHVAHGYALRPVLPRGPRDAPLCFIGRDPGAKEVEQDTPFVGEAGQVLRTGLLEVLAPHIPSTEESRLRVGEAFFWLNTVPFKPDRNKPWAMQVRRDCQPILLNLMRSGWNGTNVMVLGREAFFWFGIDQPREVRARLREFWSQGDTKYVKSIEVPLPGTTRLVRLYPLPHPSRANATWTRRFPAMLQHRLREILGAAAPP
jgi:uracil-DNA glycosylase family 4